MSDPAAVPEFRYRWDGLNAAVLQGIRVAGLTDAQQAQRIGEDGGVRVEVGEEFVALEHVNHPWAGPLSDAAGKAAEAVHQQDIALGARQPDEVRVAEPAEMAGPGPAE